MLSLRTSRYLLIMKVFYVGVARLPLLRADCLVLDSRNNTYFWNFEHRGPAVGQAQVAICLCIELLFAATYVMLKYGVGFRPNQQFQKNL